MSAGEGGGAWISPRQIYEELRKLSDMVISLSGQVKNLSGQDARITALETLANAQAAEIKTLKLQVAAQRDRQSTLDRRVWWLCMAAAATGATLQHLVTG